MISVGEEALVLIPPNDTEMDFISSCETETSSLSLQENNAILTTPANNNCLIFMSYKKIIVYKISQYYFGCVRPVGIITTTVA